SPFCALYGFEPRAPAEVPHSELRQYKTLEQFHEVMNKIREVAFENLRTALEKSMKYKNQSRRKPNDYTENQKVWIKFPYTPAQFRETKQQVTHQKFRPYYYGPYRVLRKLTELTYRISNDQSPDADGREFNAHVTNMKPFVER